MGKEEAITQRRKLVAKLLWSTLQVIDLGARTPIRKWRFLRISTNQKFPR